jgi:hypothetical protein
VATWVGPLRQANGHRIEVEPGDPQPRKLVEQHAGNETFTASRIEEGDRSQRANLLQNAGVKSIDQLALKWVSVCVLTIIARLLSRLELFGRNRGHS